MTPPGAGHCIGCGSPLEPGHRFCPACGTRRQAPAGRGPDPAPPPPLPSFLPGVFAAGAVFWLVILAQSAAVFASPVGRSTLDAQLAAAGFAAAERGPLILLNAVLLSAMLLAAAMLHGAAFRGLRGRRRWGWLLAVAVAGLWSVVVVGIPVLATLLRRDVRRACGVGRQFGAR